MQIERVLVVGSGLMGSGIAQVCAQAGVQVVLHDVSDQALVRAVEERNYGVLIKLLTQRARLELEQEIHERLSAIKAGMKDKIEVRSDKALFFYTSDHRLELIKEGDQWRISHLD